MKLQSTILSLGLAALCFLFSNSLYSQDKPVIKYFDKTTTDTVQLDFDEDGDLDFIIAGVVADKHQGRVYLVENKGNKFAKPEYIYSFPTIPVKQKLVIEHKDQIITINTTGTSPKGKKQKYVGTLIKGNFEGVLAPPATFSPN